MRIAEFALERFFARWEFAVRHLLCASDVEPWPMADLLALADDETARLWAGLRLGYTESTGHPLLRAEIAGLYETLEADDVLVFAGAEEAIFCLASVLLGPGDHAVVTWPGYQSLYEVGRSAGAEVTLHDLREADGWALDPERLIGSVQANTRLVLIDRGRIVSANLGLLDAFFADHADRVAWIRPRGGSIGFPRLLDDEPIDAFAARLVEAEGVLLLPGSAFGFEGNHFRIGFGREDLPEALAGLERFLEAG